MEKNVLFEKIETKYVLEKSESYNIKETKKFPLHNKAGEKAHFWTRKLIF